MAKYTFAQTLPVIPAAAPIAVTNNAGKPYAGGKALAFSDGAAVVYGVNKQAKRADNTEKFGQVIGDGTEVTWDEDDIACLANADLKTVAALTAANSMRVVVTVDGTPLIRDGSDAGTLVSGEFKVADASGTVELTFGAAPADGAVIQVHIADAADINTATALVARVPALQTVYDFMGTGVATATLSST